PILFRKIARVLDGQHRIAGLYDFKGESFDLPVSLFVGLDLADQAQIFATVNLEQTKVNRSLAYDLFALSVSRSPQKTCHNVAVALDRNEESPFYQRIKRLGSATPGRTFETITQANFVLNLMKYISKDEKTDRDKLLRKEKLEKADRETLKTLPLRNLFIEEKDLDIVDIVWNYFEAIKSNWPKAWDSRAQGYMLNKTNGFRASMRIFGKAYLHVVGPGEIPTVEVFLDLFEKSELKDKDFNIDNFPPGTGGEAKLANHWLNELNLD
ncbi:MAG: DGQHR domain-containing protein, partial [Sphingomonadales bacterium]